MINEPGTGGGPLVGLRVIDATISLGAYAARLLADLGADVIRIEAPAAEGTSDQAASPDFFSRFVNSSKRSMTVDLARPEGRDLLHRLLDRSDLLIESLPIAWADGVQLDPASIAVRHPQLVHVSVSPFGRDRTDGRADDDLTLLAAGGLLHLGGYPDAEPMAAYGQQSNIAASIFAAVGALVALRDRPKVERGRWVDVSAQESVAQAVEDSVATYELTGEVRTRLGSEPREAGTGVYPCADGFVTMVAGRLGTTKAWHALVAWMVEEGVPGAEALTEPEWATLPHRQRPEAIEQFGAVFAAFTADRTRLDLYRDAQHRGIALSPVNDVAAVLEDPQLAARAFFVDVDDPTAGRPLRYPGPPYRLSATPAAAARRAPIRGSDTDAILNHELRIPVDTVDSLRRSGVV
jgi:benzylsuccinate CoA-transferase BbsE subunit